MKNTYLTVLLLFWAFNGIAQNSPSRQVFALPNGVAAEIPAGPYQPTWESIEKGYHTPKWFIDGKFGIFIHWGVYSVPAHGSEWYPRHMYNGMLDWHTQNYGSPDVFGYKDFIPMFKAEKFNPDEWMSLFKEAGATYVIPTAEHHDGFAMYDSELTRWDAKEMGPKKDIIGELKQAAQKAGLKFGVSNHRMEHWDFMYPLATTKHDLFDPRYADFYGPPQKPDPNNSAMGPTQEEIMDGVVKQAPQSKEFLEEWLARCQELIDKYQPDMLWFDNGVNSRSLDDIKLRLAAYYYNRANQWGKEVSLSTKSNAYLYGTVRDFERQGRAPKEITSYYWQVDEPIGHKFGYVTDLKLQTAQSIIVKLIENISKNGNLCLNVSPQSDGTIPEDQQKVLKEVGQWLKINGEAVYGTQAWKKYGEGPHIKTNEAPCDFRFTQKSKTQLYAFLLNKGGDKLIIQSFSTDHLAPVKSVRLLHGNKEIPFKQTREGLELYLPDGLTLSPAEVFKVML